MLREINNLKETQYQHTEYAFSRNKEDTREYSKDTQLLKILLKHTTSKMKSKTEMKAGGTEDLRKHNQILL